MTTVILAEKPSQARDYTAAFQNSARHKGYYTVSDPSFNNGREVIITYALGHLVNLAAPGDYFPHWKKWDLDTLPIFPETYQYNISESTKDQFDIISELLLDADHIIIATDSGREGSNIAWLIMSQAGVDFERTKIERLWINSLEEDAVREGLANLRDGISEDYPLFQEAQTRQIADWLIGMNASPLYSLHLQKKGISGSFSVGRVQTPTLNMVFQRKKKIDNFVSDLFFELEGTAHCDTGDFKVRLNPYLRFKDIEESSQHLNQHNAVLGKQKSIVDALETKSKSKDSPFLYSLSSAQKEANKLFKMGAKQTLDTIASLYEKKFLSYPRTDSRFITENEFAFLLENAEKYREFLDVKLPITQKKPRKRFVDGSKVGEHHALIPTKRTPTNEEFEAFTENQQKIYLMILKTTLAMFLPNYEFDETIVDIKAGNLIFTAKGIQPRREGWKAIFPELKEEKNSLPSGLKENESILLTIKNVEKKTTPPDLFTEGTLIDAMLTAGKTVEDEEAQILLKEVEGIGTEATRANIIETLKQKEYIVIKNNKVVITEKGIILCEAVSKRKLLTSAEMTAEWERYLRKIGSKSGGKKQVFLNNVKKFVIHLIENVPEDIQTLDTAAYEKDVKEKELAESFGTCPDCGGIIKHKKSFYGCSNYPKCRFTLSDSFRKKKLTRTNVSDLLKGDSTTVKGIQSSKKEPYAAVVALQKNSESGKRSLQFVSFAKTTKKKSSKKKATK